MTWLIVPTNKLATLDTLNEAHTDRKCIPIKTTDNKWLTNSDKLGDSYWADYHSFLNSLEPFEGTPEFPISEE